MAYRDHLAALESRAQALAEEVRKKQLELGELEHLLDQAREKNRLPVLPNIQVASPCSADWQAMAGDERARHCGDCNKQVYNLSELTREEAEALIIEKEGKLCVRYYQRKDGTILMKDCDVGRRRKRWRGIVASGAAMLAGAGALAYREVQQAREVASERAERALAIAEQEELAARTLRELELENERLAAEIERVTRTLDSKGVLRNLGVMKTPSGSDTQKPAKAKVPFIKICPPGKPMC